MSGLDLNKLQQYKDEILKAEIGALLFNLGKTHAGISNWKDYFPTVNSLFSSYKDYYTPTHFETELLNVDIRLKDFILGKKVQLPNNEKLDWVEFFKGDASNENIIQQIFFRGCENINSGIDKGSPQDANQLNKLWISNAFGSLRKEVNDEKDFDNSRLCFFREFHRFLEDNNYYNSPNWKEIRNWVLEHIKPWYSRLLSDSRFPVNDVTLFDQAYMTASLFKAVLASLYLNNSNFQNFLDNPQSIKWSILGIQYDKLGLAEKGLKVASIKWYRDTANEVDNEIKKLIEITYPLGNEVYRDETGIYFVVGENVIGDEDGDFYRLNSNLDELKEEIQQIFSDKFRGEIYPAIFLTEPSRGIMNLGHHVEKARKNFLKAEIPEDFEDILKPQFDNNPNGICQTCKVRLAHKGDKENLICNVCAKRQQGRIKKWLNNYNDENGETIWLDELQDKDGRIALITLKFELGKWLNGDMVNSLVIQNTDFLSCYEEIKNFIYLFLTHLPFDLQIDKLQNQIRQLEDSLRLSNDRNEKKILGKKKSKLAGIVSKLEKTKKLIDNLRNIQWFEKPLSESDIEPAYTGKDFDGLFEEIKKIYDTIRDNYPIRLLDKISLFPRELSSDAYSGHKKHNETFNDYIKQIFFGSIKGNKWEKLIRNSIINNKINWSNETIIWQDLTYQDIAFLAFLILQFLLRKNPSPARLRRIWEGTREFFEKLEAQIMDLSDIPKWRRKSLVFEGTIQGSFDKDSNKREKEFECNGLLYWAVKKGNNKAMLYLISSIERFIEKYGKAEIKKAMTEGRVDALNDFFANEASLKNVLEEKQIELEEYMPNKKTSPDQPAKITINLHDFTIRTYKPYFTILSPTPVSWQFIIPAENVPALIKSVQEEYYKNFKWVYGKLPLHIGIIVQNYKKPLYVGINALRRIRRDKVNWYDLGIKVSGKELKARQKVAFNYQQSPEQSSQCEAFYSLFEKTSGQGKYEFYLYPDKNKVWLETTQNSDDTDEFKIYPNTFDFEFLDTNTRRNDIYYRDVKFRDENYKIGKRFMKIKRNRPYDLYDWQYYEKFREYFFSDKKSSSKLQKLVSLIYAKLEDWEGENEGLKLFMESSFVNILELKDKEQQDEFAGVLGLTSFEELKNLSTDEFKSKLLIILDMFDFWHTLLKWEA